MTRMERLLHLVNLFKVKDKISLDELILESGVSKRTMYRDLETLSKMNVPIRYDNGYHLTGDVSLPTFNFSEEEKELIGCSLKCSPLSKLPRFRNIIKDIERKILATSGDNQRDSLNNYLQSAHSETEVFGEDENIIIDRFIRSMERRIPLTILLKNGESIEGLIPKSLNIREDGWDLTMYKENDGNVFSISLADISMLESNKTSAEIMTEI